MLEQNKETVLSDQRAGPGNIDVGDKRLGLSFINVVDIPLISHRHHDSVPVRVTLLIQPSVFVLTKRIIIKNVGINKKEK